LIPPIHQQQPRSPHSPCRLTEAADILRKGGVGVIPTDTCYTFACDILSRKGVERVGA
ncbi:unnamed protein product, partial [Scytosiphon promiscuus]